MRFVLEEKEPVLSSSVDFYIYLHCAGVDLFRLIQFVKKSLPLEILCCDGAHIHEIHRFSDAELFSYREIFLVGLPYLLVLEAYVIYSRQECRMPAVIGPVCIYHPDLCDSRVSSLFSEIRLAEGYVSLIHGKSQLLYEFRKLFPVHIRKTGHRLDFSRYGIFHLKGIRKLKGCLSRLNGVDDIMLDRLLLLIGYLSPYHVYLCGPDCGLVLLGDELYALGCGISSLIELSRQEFDCENERLRVHRK